MEKNRRKGLQLGIPDYITIETEEASVVLTKSSVVSAEKTKVEFAETEEGEDIFLTSHDAVKGVKLRWNYAFPKGAKFLGDAWERGYGDLEWRGMSGSRFMPWYFLVSVPNETWCFGVKVRPSAMCYWQADSEGITLYLDVRCGGRGVLLDGRTLHVAQIVCSQETEKNVYEAARSFCRRMCSDPVLPKEPVYGSNNWYYAYGDSTEEKILKDTDYILELTEGAKTPPFMVIDDCWEEHRRMDGYCGGPWRKGNERFPDMEGLAQKMKEKGVRTGIWMRFLLNEDETIPDSWRLSHNQCLDPSHPEVQAYIKEDIKTICRWGFSMIKHDFSTYDLFGKWGFEMNPLVTEEGWSFYDKHKTSAEIVKLFYKLIYDTAEEYGTMILGCNTMGHLGAGLMHINRTGDDTSGLNWERTRRMGINTLAFRLAQHGTFYHVDADCVGITGNIAWEMNRQWAEVIALSGTPLFISAKPGVLNPQEQEQLHQILLTASEQKHHMIPADWEDTDCPEIWEEDGKTVSYHWYEKSGQKLESKTEKYAMYIPIP